VIRSAWHRIVVFLRSAGYATVLLLLLGVWSMVGTIVPQDSLTTKPVVGWAASHPLVEPALRFLGLHSAFSSPIFLTLVVALSVSTALCAWQRTKVALHRAGTLRDAALTKVGSLAKNHDLEIACDSSLDPGKALSVASATLGRIGVKTKQRGELLSAVSPQWTAWGSPVFHWALVGLLLALLVGNTLRSEGLMGVVVGQTVPDAPKSYGVLHAGSLHDWRRVHRSIRVDGLEPNYETGGVDRGPTPTVSLLDGSGNVIKSQRVYPNNTLKTGSLTIYPSSYGLAAVVSEITTSGAVLGRGMQLVDFSPGAAGGTIAAGGIAVLNASGAQVYLARLTVPLEEADGGWSNQVPHNPSVRVVVTSRDGATVVDRVVQLGDTLAVPGSTGLRVDNVLYYARLQVVDDWTIPLLYGGLVVALVGLSIATLARQQIVLATVVETPDGVRLVAKVRLWRNSSSSRSEMESELTAALGGADKENAL
jgi:cytochrome c biogenesis protein ResB